MIPIRDTIRARRFPVITVSIIAANVLVFLFQLTLSGDQAHVLVTAFGIVPAVQLHLFAAAPLSGGTWIPLFSSMFIHGSWLHLLSNMWFLWIFGDNVEDILGRGRYLFFYLLVGLAGGLAHILTNTGSMVPTIGASGAVAGVLGAYFVSFSRSRVLTLVPLLFFITFIELPALVFLLIWFALQLINGLAALAGGAAAVAWWAHIGGFAAGMVLVKLLIPDRMRIRPS